MTDVVAPGSPSASPTRPRRRTVAGGRRARRGDDGPSGPDRGGPAPSTADAATPGGPRPAAVAVVIVELDAPTTPMADDALGSRPKDAAPGLERELAPAQERLRRTLVSLAAQVPPVQILVTAPDAPEWRAAVERGAPGAFLRTVSARRGWAAAANDAARHVTGAPLLFFCAPGFVAEPGAVAACVDEAMRSNAALVGPKLLTAEPPERLVSVGLGLDRAGRAVALIDATEIDQGQYDVAREVPALSAGALLVRHDLLLALGGFDEDATPDLRSGVGEELDLASRARVAGARVMVAPDARVRGPVRSPDPRVLEANRVRTLVAVSTAPRLLALVPVLALQLLVRAVLGVLRGEPELPRASVAGLLTALRRPGRLLAARRRVQSQRRLSERAFLRPLAPVGAGLRDDLRRELAADSNRAWALAERTLGDEAIGRWRAPAVGALAVLLVFGSRHLLRSPLPVVGQFLHFGSGSDLLAEGVRGWRSTGLGIPSIGPGAFFVLGPLRRLLGERVLALGTTVGMLPVGLLGMWRLAGRVAVVDSGRERSRGSLASAVRRGGLPSTVVPTTRLIATLAYAAVPVPYDAFAGGHRDALLLYGLLPWLWSRAVTIVRAGAAGAADGEPGVGLDDAPAASPPADARPSLGARVSSAVRLGAPAALVAALVPSGGVTELLCAASIVVGAVLAGLPAAARRAGGRCAAAAVAAALLGLPWLVDGLRGLAAWSTAGGAARAVHWTDDPVDILRLGAGPVSGGPLTLLLAVVALVPLVLAEGDRLLWAARAWVLALLSAGVAYAGLRGWLGQHGPAPEALLVPIGCAWALCAGLGLGSARIDVRRRQFGWRQSLLVVATVAAFASGVPVLRGAADGRWHAATDDLGSALGWLRGEGGVSTLWIGSPMVLPADGQRLDTDLAYLVTPRGIPDERDRHVGPLTPALRGVRAVAQLVRAQGTDRAGAALGALGVRVVVLAERDAPAGAPVALDPQLLAGFAGQLDLRKLDGPAGFTVYEVPDALATGAARPTPSRRTAARTALLLVAALLWAGALMILRRGRRGAVRAALVEHDPTADLPDLDPLAFDVERDRWGDPFATDPFGAEPSPRGDGRGAVDTREHVDATEPDDAGEPDPAVGAEDASGEGPVA